VNNNLNKFLYLIFFGVFLLSACVIGTCISSTSVYNQLSTIQNRVLLVPYIISYSLILIGLLGFIDIVKIVDRFNKDKH